MNALVTIWMLATIGSQGELRQIGDYRTRAACESRMAEGMAKGLPLRCMQTAQLVPKAYFDSLE